MKLALRPEAEDLELIATDFFEDMLSVARDRVAGTRIRVERQDVHALSYPDRYARYVLSRSTLHHWAHPAVALRNIHRILEPGGVALIHDVRRDAPRRIVERLNEQRVALGIGPMLLEEKFIPEEIRQICKEAGLAEEAAVLVSSSGPAALGFELRIKRSKP